MSTNNTAEYVFLKDPNQEGQTTYYAIHPNKIETLAVSETYDKFGQAVDSSTAGDYLTLDSQKAATIANQAYHAHQVELGNLDESDEIPQKFNLSDYVSAYEQAYVYDTIRQSEDLTEDKDYTVVKETCQGFNYWDGHNWKTATVQVENGEPDFEIEDDEETISELLKAISEMEWQEDKFGKKVYSGNGYRVTESSCQGDWEIYSLTLAD